MPIFIFKKSDVDYVGVSLTKSKGGAIPCPQYYVVLPCPNQCCAIFFEQENL